MNDCCKETLEEVRLTIKKLPITNIYEVLGMLNVECCYFIVRK